MSNKTNIVGVSTSYTPAAFPQVVYSKEGKSVLAVNPDHLTSLIDSGWSTEFIAAPVTPKQQIINGTESEREIAKLKISLASLGQELTDSFNRSSRQNAELVSLQIELDAAKAELATVKQAYTAATEELEKVKVMLITSQTVAPAPEPEKPVSLKPPLAQKK